MPQGYQGRAGVNAPPFAVHSERTNGSRRIRLLGELDLSVIESVDREMRRAEASDAPRIVLDLGELEFMDASGVRLLLQLSVRSASNGNRLRIMGSRAPQVRRVLELTGADDALPLTA